MSVTGKGLVGDDMAKTIGFTGHRPSYLGGSNGKIYQSMRLLIYGYLSTSSADLCLIGMATGWDTAAAQMCVELGIPFKALVPFQGYEKRMCPNDQDVYYRLLERASEVQYVCDPGYDTRKMHIRNKFIVNGSNRVCALYSGAPSGTAQCVKYAMSVGKPVDNLWKEWTTMMVGK